MHILHIITYIIVPILQILHIILLSTKMFILFAYHITFFSGRPTFSYEISEISEAFRKYRQFHDMFRDFRNFRKILDH
jgi:hypothetical protein